MATVTLTFAAGTEAGATIRQLANQLLILAADLPDRHSSGPSIVLTIDNAPATGTASVQLTAGPEVYTKQGKKGV